MQAFLISQSQTNASDLKLFPPCLMHYMSTACPTISSTSMCTKGTFSNVTIIKGSVSIATNPGTLTTSLPNMYDIIGGVLQLGGVLIGQCLLILCNFCAVTRQT